MSLLLLLINFTLPGITYQGDRIFYYDAHSLALGGISIISEHGDNPAATGLVHDLAIFSSAAFISNNEKRGLRVYDSYGNNMGISTISNNSSTEFGLGASSLVIPVKILRIGFRYLPLWDFGYAYRFEYRDDFYQITQIVEDVYSGSVYSVSPILAVNYKFLSLGFEERFIFGKRSRDYHLTFPNADDSLFQTEAEFDGTTSRFGIVFEPNIHFRFAYAFGLNYTLRSSATEDSMHYPNCHSFAALYQPAGRIPTKFLCGIDYENWSDAIFIYRVGIEHTILARYALRYGFCIFPDYNDASIWTTALSFGLGINNQDYYLDFGFAYGKRDYSSLDFSAIELDQGNLEFNESTSHFLLSGGFSF